MKHLIKAALVMLGAVAAYFVYGFTAKVSHPGVALFAAASLVSTYVGLAYAPMSAKQRKHAGYVAWAAMIIEALYGFHYVLELLAPQLFAPPMPFILAAWLAFLHGSAFTMIGFFVTTLVIHAETPQERDETTRNEVERLRNELEQMTLVAGSLSFTVRELAEISGVSVSALYRAAKRRAELTDGNSAS